MGKAMMLEASFNTVPLEMAAPIVVAAAGLVPPTATEKTITRRGPVDLAALSNENWLYIGDQLAAYKGPDKQWRYFIHSHHPHATAASVLKWLFGDRESYVIGFAGGSISVRLVNVTLEQALKAILGSTGSTYRIEDGVYVIQQPLNPSPIPPAAKPAEQGTE